MNKFLHTFVAFFAESSIQRCKSLKKISTASFEVEKLPKEVSFLLAGKKLYFNLFNYNQTMVYRKKTPPRRRKSPAKKPRYKPKPRRKSPVKKPRYKPKPRRKSPAKKPRYKPKPRVRSRRKSPVRRRSPAKKFRYNLRPRPRPRSRSRSRSRLRRRSPVRRRSGRILRVPVPRLVPAAPPRLVPAAPPRLVPAAPPGRAPAAPPGRAPAAPPRLVPIGAINQPRVPFSVQPTPMREDRDKICQNLEQYRDRACPIFKCLSELKGLQGNSASPTDTWILSFKDGTMYGKKPLKNAFMKWWITPRTVTGVPK